MPENKVWLIDAYDRESGETVSFLWGKRDLKNSRDTTEKTSCFRDWL